MKRIILLLPLLLTYFYSFAQYPEYKIVREDIPVTNPNLSILIPLKIDTMDFNNDNLNDFCITEYNGAEIKLFHQQPLGGFIPMSISVLPNPVRTIGEDFNNDNFIDILVINNTGTKFNLLLADGFGGYINTLITTNAICDGNCLAKDFNNDGNLDLLISSGAVFFMPGNGDGTFGARSQITSSTILGKSYGSDCLASGDFNSDGNEDFVIGLDYPSATFGILIGNGNGTFLSQVNYGSFPSSVNSIFVEDFNKDGILDIISSSNHLKVNIGIGDGTFVPTALSIQALSTHSSNAFNGGKFEYVDLNNDTFKDFIIYYAHSVSNENGKVVIIRGNSDGTFTPVSMYPSGDYIADIEVADMNADGLKDIIIRNSSSGYVSLLKSNGDLTFGSDIWMSSIDAPNQLFLSPSFVQGLSILDINSDAKKDVVSGINSDKLSGFNGNGDGTFQSASTIHTLTTSCLTESSDLNNDGQEDLVVYYGNTGNTVYALLNLGGVFSAPINVSLSQITIATRLKIRDVNNDGNQDLVMLNYGNAKFEVQLGNGDGTFTYSGFFASSESYNFEMVDVDNDAIIDIVAAACSTSSIKVFKGNGLGLFNSPSSYAIASYCSNIGLNDYNHDNYPDLVICNPQSNNIRVYMNNQVGGFNTVGSSFSVGSKPVELNTDDINNDGNPDILVLNNESNDMCFFPGKGDGTFWPMKFYPVRVSPTLIRTSDINSDGVLDVVVKNSKSKDISFFISDNKPWLMIEPSSLNLTTTYGTVSPIISYKVYAGSLNTSLNIQAPTGIEISTDAVSFFSTISLVPISGNFPPYQTIYVRTLPTLSGGIHDLILSQSTSGLNSPISLHIVVNKALLTISIANASRIYGNSNPLFHYSISGLLLGEDSTVLDQLPVISTTATTNSIIGLYQIVGSNVIDDNYSITVQSGTLTISKATLTIAADDIQSAYGEFDGNLFISYTGFKLGETETVINVLPTISTTANNTSTVGAYPIILTGGSDNNYNLVLVAGTLTISKATLTITADDIQSSYGEFDGNLFISYSGFKLGETEAVINVLPTISTSANNTSAVGAYPIIVSGGSDDNYNLILETGTLTITKAPLTITANNIQALYGEFDGNLSVSYAGFKLGELEAVINVLPTISTTADNTSAVGIYPIIVSGGSDNNYDLILIDGSLTILNLTSVNNINEMFNLNLFPNPASNKVIIEGYEKVDKIIIYNNLGSIVGEYFQNEINVSDFTNGLYYVHVYMNGKHGVREMIVYE